MVRNVKRLELHVSNHCNLSCRGCSHLSPLESCKFINEQVTLRSLVKLKHLLFCDDIHLLGGEPLLYPNLEEFVDKIKSIGISKRITIATNGLLLDKVKKSLWHIIDEANISIYGYSLGVKNKILNYVMDISKKYKTIFNILEFSCFREPYAEIKCDDRELVDKVYRSCIVTHVWQCYNLYEDYLFKCPQSLALSKHFFHNLDMNGLRIQTGAEFEKRLDSYLNSSIPLLACFHCLGAVGKKIPLQQIKDTDNWIECQNKSYEKMIDYKFMDEVLMTYPQILDDIVTVDRTQTIKDGTIIEIR